MNFYKFLQVSLGILLIFSIPIITKAAVLYLMPQSQNVYQGDSFLVELRLDSENEEINTAEINLKIPSNLLEILDFGKGGTILTFWAKEPELKNDVLSLIGGIPRGFEGDGLIGKITFLAKGLGKAEVNFRDDSKVLLNNGKGTPVKLNFLEGNYEVIRKPEGLPIISSRTHPDQNKWYKETTLHLHWDLVEGAEYSFLLSKDPLAEPDEIPDKPEGELIWMGDMEYPNLEDGIYYFHLKQKLPGKDWSEKTVFRAMIDSVPPEEFKPEIGRDPAIFEGKYFLSFATVDKMSGIDHYETLETRDKKQDIWKKVESPYLLEDQSLRSEILVKAVDKAGNEKISEILPLKKPFPYWIVVLILVGVMLIWWIIKRIKHKFTQI